MQIIIEVPDSLVNTKRETDWIYWKSFLQSMTNRYCQGACRYGKLDKRQEYARRLYLELEIYLGIFNVFNNTTQKLDAWWKRLRREKSGNFEQLLNIAVYCFLESEAPQHPRFHFDNKVKSVTREVLRLR